MVENRDNIKIKETAEAINSEIHELPVKNAPALRAVHNKYTQKLKQAEPGFILGLARELFKSSIHPGIAFGFISDHKEALRKIGEAELTEFGVGMNSWDTVDSFAALLSGPAWRQRQIPDQLIHKWAHSEDCWWRRAALVSTVALNRKTFGGKGDIPRTLKVCKMLAEDRDDMVVKAMSWALRELIIHDADAVRKFLAEYDNVLASRVKREVNNKLTIGLKNPRRTNKKYQQ